MSEVVVVDARGRRCPLPVIDLARAAKGAPAGSEIEVLADDPAAPGDLAAWCALKGHVLVGDSPAEEPGEPGQPGELGEVRRIRVRLT